MDLGKNLIIIIFLLSAVLLVLLFLNLNKSWKGEPAQLSKAAGQARIIEGQRLNSPKKISRGPVKFFDLMGPNKIIFYDESDSMIYESYLDGRNKKEIARIPNISGIIFGPNGKNIIAAISKNKEIKKFYFDLENNKRVELSSGIGGIAFSPSGNQIAYHFYDEGSGEGNISISNPDGSVFKTILKTRIKDFEIFWPETGLIVFYSKNEPGPAFSLSPETGKLQRLTEPTPLLKFSGGKTSPLNDYAVFISPEDGKLYSLLK